MPDGLANPEPSTFIMGDDGNLPAPLGGTTAELLIVSAPFSAS